MATCGERRVLARDRGGEPSELGELYDLFGAVALRPTTGITRSPTRAGEEGQQARGPRLPRTTSLRPGD